MNNKVFTFSDSSQVRYILKVEDIKESQYRVIPYENMDKNGCITAKHEFHKYFLVELSMDYEKTGSASLTKKMILRIYPNIESSWMSSFSFSDYFPGSITTQSGTTNYSNPFLYMKNGSGTIIDSLSNRPLKGFPFFTSMEIQGNTYTNVYEIPLGDGIFSKAFYSINEGVLRWVLADGTYLDLN